MKKIVLVLVLSLILGISTAYAEQFWVGSVFNPNVGFVPNVMGLDESSSGSGVALTLGPAGTSPVAGTNFNFYYQANIVGATDPVGAAIPSFTTGLNSNFEYTIVAKIPETVLAFVPFGPPFPPSAGVSLFSTLAGGDFYILYNDATTGGTKSNVAAGTGFDDGIVAAHGTFNPGQISSFTATSAAQGIGSFIFEGLVDFANPLYFDPALDIFDFRAEGTLNIPPLDSTTVGFFVGPGVYADYTPLASNDLLFKVDASSKFSTEVPEPSTIILLGAGLLGLAGFARKRIKK